MFRSSGQRQNESARKYLDFSAVSPGLDNAVEVTAHALGFPTAMVNILDQDNQYTLVAFGLPEGGVLPRSQAACSTVLRIGRTVVVSDVAAVDEDNDDIADVVQTLRENGMASYASTPLYGRESVAVGTLCVIDSRPHALDDSHIRLLEQLAVMVEEHLDGQRSRSRVMADRTKVDRLAHAMDAGEIQPWFEPIVDLKTGRVVAVEALARWESPDRGVLAPGEFIGQIENTDVIVDLDLHILHRALASLRSCDQNTAPVTMSVNISGVHLERSDGVQRICEVVALAGVDPTAIALEITETARSIAIEDEARFVSELRAVGFTVLLDDLGSGWSPLGRLTHIPIDGFKLDRSVSASMHTRIGDALARAMLHFADELAHVVVLEGIDTAAKLNTARLLGFTCGQGHLFSPAVPTHKLAGLLGAGPLIPS